MPLYLLDNSPIARIQMFVRMKGKVIEYVHCMYCVRTVALCVAVTISMRCLLCKLMPEYWPK